MFESSPFSGSGKITGTDTAVRGRIGILVVAFETGRWGPARLVRPLHESGFRTAALCPDDNALAKTRFLDRHFQLKNVRSSRQIALGLAQALRIWRPALIVPADERALASLHAIVRERKRFSSCGIDADARALIVASLGNPDKFNAMLMKDQTLQLARDLGLPVPESTVFSPFTDALGIAERIGFPVYLKASFSWAGMGVTLCQNAAELTQAIETVGTPKRLPFRRLIRRVLNRDWYPDHSAIEIQKAIQGAPAMYCGVANQGRLLAGFSGFVQQTTSATGPSCAVRLGNNPQMTRAAAILTEAFGASGFIGFDFMIETATGVPYLIECNPRPIQVCHLGDKVGVDLCAALAAAMRGQCSPFIGSKGNALITLFPQAWLHDPLSIERTKGALDAPWDDAPLLRAMVENPS